MNNFITQGNKLISFLLILLFIQACGGGQTRSSILSNNNQLSLEQLIKQAQKASPEQKGPLLVQAAGLLVKEERFEKSQELLIRVNRSNLTPSQMDDFYLYYGETLLGLEAYESSLEQLKKVQQTKTKPIDWQIRYAQSLSDSFLANHNYFEAAKLRIELDDLITDDEQLKVNNDKIWSALNQIEAPFLKSLISDFNSQRVNGWLDIVYINKQWGHHPAKLMSEIAMWKNRFPLHPSLVHQPETLSRTETAITFNPKKIAVLLPLTGKLSSVGKTVQEGIIAAHYQSENSNDRLLSFYDTAKSLYAITPYQQAINDGADFVVGPLTRESVSAILSQEKLSTPILTLNQIDTPNLHNYSYQFGLPVEDEAIQAAHYAFEKGHKKAIAFFPNNTTGERAEKAFKEYFEGLGGELVYAQKYSDKKLFKQNVQRMLRVDSSMNRKKALERLLGRNLEFEMRRRQDVDFIFIHARSQEGRMIKPFINYYFAHDLPVIATSAIFSGKQSPKKDVDLNGIEFPHIPLLISEKENFQSTRNVLTKIAPDNLDAKSKYFALGFDSYKIIGQLSILKAFSEYRWNGLSGELAVDPQGHVRRFLTWAQFNRGIPNVVKEREVKELEPFDNNDLLNLPTNENMTDSIKR